MIQQLHTNYCDSIRARAYRVGNFIRPLNGACVCSRMSFDIVCECVFLAFSLLMVMWPDNFNEIMSRNDLEMVSTLHSILKVIYGQSQYVNHVFTIVILLRSSRALPQKLRNSQKKKNVFIFIFFLSSSDIEISRLKNFGKNRIWVRWVDSTCFTCSLEHSSVGPGKISI